jgi:hypothetical protein
VTHGVQTVIVSDVRCTRPRAYNNRHKLHYAPTGWTKQGPLELRRVMEQLIPMIKVEASADNDDDEDDNESDIDEDDAISNEPKKIFKQPPGFTFDNYFTDDKVLDLLGTYGSVYHKEFQVSTCVRRRV